MTNVIHVVNVHGSSERHYRARHSWRHLYDRGVEYVWVHKTSRSAQDLGDKRNVPFLKDLLRSGMAPIKSDDILFWCNDDVILDPRLYQWCLNDVAKNDAMSMRRIEIEMLNGVHIGRELFAFKKSWLEENWELIPDFLIGCPCFDIVLAAIIRKDKGLKSTLENMKEDYPLCEATERYAIHENHASGWAGSNEHTYPGNIYNKNLAKSWCAAHMPSLKL